MLETLRQINSINMRTFIQQHPLRMLAGLVLLSFAIPSVSLAQQADTVRVQPAATTLQRKLRA